MKFNYPVGATPLNSDEIAGLIPGHIITQSDLNEWEQFNIITAENWLYSRQRKNIFTLDFCKQIHKKMFNQTWSWAGQFRKSNKNIGVFWEQIPMQLKLLFDDILYQIKNEVYSVDELASRFHHRLVFIHPFVNGNGRHARLMTDVLLLNLNSNKFTWGSENLIASNEVRNNYINALRDADKGNYKKLLQFVRG